VTGLNILTDRAHEPYRTKRGKIEQMLRIGGHAMGLVPKGPLPGAYPMGGPGDASASSSQASSLGPLSPNRDTHEFGVPKTKQGKFDFLACGIFACFNMGRQILGSEKRIGSVMMRSTTGLRNAERRFVPTRTFLTLLSVSLGSLILPLLLQIRGLIWDLGFRGRQPGFLFGACCKRGSEMVNVNRSPSYLSFIYLFVLARWDV
jgi:hypothetical protein